MTPAHCVRPHDARLNIAVAQWPDIPVLVRSRLLPTYAGLTGIGHYGDRKRTDHAVRVEMWFHAMLEVQDALRQAFLKLFAACSDVAAEITPIKGTDALLWEAGRVGCLYTRDIDLLVSEHAYECASAYLRREGFERVWGNDNGKVARATEDQWRVWERGRHEWYPWTSFVRMPQLDALAGELNALDDASSPLVTDGKRVYLGIEFDFHHSMWPAVERRALESGVRPSGALHCSRLALPDQIVVNCIRVGPELARGNVEALGSLAQLLRLVDRYSSRAIAQNCAERAHDLDVEALWNSGLATLRRAIGPSIAGDERYPQPDEQLPDAHPEALELALPRTE